MASGLGAPLVRSAALLAALLAPAAAAAAATTRLEHARHSAVARFAGDEVERYFSPLCWPWFAPARHGASERAAERIAAVAVDASLRGGDAPPAAAAASSGVAATARSGAPPAATPAAPDRAIMAIAPAATTATEDAAAPPRVAFADALDTPYRLLHEVDPVGIAEDEEEERWNRVADAAATALLLRSRQPVGSLGAPGAGPKSDAAAALLPSASSFAAGAVAADGSLVAASLLPSHRAKQRRTAMLHDSTAVNFLARHPASLLPDAPLDGATFAVLPAASFAALTVAGVVKFLALCSSVASQASPLGSVLGFRKAGTVPLTIRDPAPYFAVFYSGFQWVYYGGLAYWVTRNPGFLFLIQGNIVGLCLGSFYIVQFLYYCPADAPEKGVLSGGYLFYSGLAVLLEVLAALFSPSLDRALLYSGVVAAGASLLLSFAPLATVSKVLEHRDSETIPPQVVTASLVSSFLWTWCGALLGDPWVSVPNAFSLLVALVCAWLILKFPAGSSRKVLASAGVND